MTVTIHHGRSEDVLRGFEPSSFSACVTDPPYALTADRARWRAKSGEAFEARTDLDPPATRRRGAPRAGFMGHAWDAELPGPELWAEVLRVLKPGASLLAFGSPRTFHRLACTLEDVGFELRDVLAWLHGQGYPKSFNVARGAGEAWNGYGTALKPAWEPILWAMKPLEGTFAENAARHGVAGVKVDACRIPVPAGAEGPEATGRWPANLVLDEAAAELVDAQAGDRPGMKPAVLRRGSTTGRGMGFRGAAPDAPILLGRGDDGGPSRFFFTSKATTAEKTAGGEVENGHPTVKPLDLVGWMLDLVTMPEGNRILEPFAGSGTTPLACLRRNLECVAIEQDAASVETARARCVADAPLYNAARVEVLPWRAE